MNEEYKKISPTEVEVSTTTVEKVVINLDGLLYELDSLERTKVNNLEDVAARNADIDGMIADLTDKIAKARAAGIKTAAEANPVREIPLIKP